MDTPTERNEETMMFSEQTLAELRHEKSRRELRLSRLKADREVTVGSAGLEAEITQMERYLAEYARLVDFAEGVNRGAVSPERDADDGEKAARAEVLDWLLRGVDNLDSVDAVAALDRYVDAVYDRGREDTRA